MTTQEDFESYDGGDYKIFVGRVRAVACLHPARVEPSELSGSFFFFVCCGLENKPC